MKAKKYAKLFAEEKIIYDGFCVSEKAGNQDNFMGHPVYSIGELTEEQKQYGIYLALNPMNRRQVMFLLEEKGLAGQAFFSENLDKYVNKIYAGDNK